MNKTISAIGAACALAAASTAWAENYQTEIGGQFLDLDGTRLWGGDATLFLKQVDTRQGPLAEAAFTDRASNIGVAYLRERSGDFDLAAVTGEFYVGNAYFAARYGRLSNGFKLNEYGVRGGLMVARNTRVTAGYDRVEAPFGSDLDIWSVGAKHLMNLAGDTALNLEGEIGVARNGGSDLYYSVQADYYLSRSLSLGARYSGVESDDEWGLGARLFFTPRISGGVEYTRANSDNIYGLRLAARF